MLTGEKSQKDREREREREREVNIAAHAHAHGPACLQKRPEAQQVPW